MRGASSGRLRKVALGRVRTGAGARLLLAAAMLALGAPAAAQDAAPKTTPDTTGPQVVETLPMTPNRMAIDVRIGEHGPYRFLVDTGAQNTIVGSALAARLALPPGRAARVIGVAGMLAVPTVTIDEFALGRRSVYNLLAPLLDERDIGADGIVGIDSLQEQRVVIDFRKQVMLIDEARRAAATQGYDIVVLARRRSGQLVMTNARIDGVAVSVVIDTGAEVSIGNLALLAALRKRGSALTETTLTSVTGQTVPAVLAPVRRLEIHGMTISNAELAFVDAPPFGALGLAQRPAVLLGMRELRVFPRIAIDFPDRKVLFDLPDAAIPPPELPVQF